MVATDWPVRVPARKDRYRSALEAIRTVDTVNGTYRPAPSYTDAEEWMDMAWSDPWFRAWFPRMPGAGLVSVEPRMRAGWRVAKVAAASPGGGRQVVLQIGPGLCDVDLATALGAAGRCAGVFGAVTVSTVLDGWTVTLATAVLGVHDRGRAKEYWDLMAAAGVPGKPPTVPGWPF